LVISSIPFKFTKLEELKRLNLPGIKHSFQSNGVKLQSKNKTFTPPGGFTNVQFNKVAAATNNTETYEGKITTLNFLTGLQINFNARIHVRNYAASHQSALLVEISPQACNHPVWDKLDSIVNGFKLNK